MHTYRSLYKDLKELKINKTGTLFVHSSMKSIGDVDGGADTVLDVLCDYMKDGLLVFPTHSWEYIDSKNPRFYVETSPSCVGILPEIFRKRKNVYRSLHPTHSVAAFGKDAEKYISGEEQQNTPCSITGCYGKLLDRKASIMFIGVGLNKNTYMHGVEQWAGVPDRITETQEDLYTILADGSIIHIPSYRHGGTSDCIYFPKIENIFIKHSIMYKGKFGDAEVRVCDVVKMTEITYKMLKIKPDLFTNDEECDDFFKDYGI